MSSAAPSPTAPKSFTLTTSRIFDWPERVTAPVPDCRKVTSAELVSTVSDSALYTSIPRRSCTRMLYAPAAYSRAGVPLLTGYPPCVRTGCAAGCVSASSQ